jgi:hypothetical protein
MHIFQQEVLTPKFNISDYWNRYEWQARSSTHNHDLYWCDGAPPATANMSNELKDAFARLWGIHVTGSNPEPDSGPRPHTETPMLQTPGRDLENTAIVLSSAVNRVQAHVHTDYCMKVNKTTKQKECRFWLPDVIKPR